MYALVKRSGKYDVIEKEVLTNQSRQVHSKSKKKSRKSKIYKKRHLIAYNDNAELLKNIQKNLNASRPQVLIHRIKNSNDNPLITFPQVATSNVEADLSNVEDFQSSDYFNKSSIEKQYNKAQDISSFDDHNTTKIILPLSAPTTNIYLDDSFDSQNPIIHDVFLHKDSNTNLTINTEQQYLPTVLGGHKDNKCHIVSNIALDQSLNIVRRSETSFTIRRKSKDILLNNNSLDSSQYDNNTHIYSKMDIEPLLDAEVSFTRDISSESKLTNITDISQADPTYEPSQFDTTLENRSANTSNEMLSSNNISSNKENKDNNALTSPDKENETNDSLRNKSSEFYNELSNAQPGACDDAQMFVASSRGRSGAGKKNFCIYCKTFQSKIYRHLERVHKDKADVQKFIDLPKGNTERRRIIDTIRRNGNFLFNTNIKYNDGELIVCRRPNPKMLKNPEDFQACINCKGYFSKTTIRHHFRYCVGRSKKRNRSINVLGRAITGRIHEAANLTLATVVFPVLREDRITRLIRYDELLIKYANKLCDKYKLQHQHDMIRSRLRLLGRFLIALKSINPNIDNFTLLYNPKYYDHIIQAVNEVAGFDSQTNVYKTPSNATNLGTLLKQIGNTLITECIKKSDYSTKQSAEDLIKLITEDYAASVARTALETQSQQKRKKKVILPTTEDISKLYNHLKEMRQSCYDKLKKKFSYNVWLTLAKATLVAVQVFNRRRAGETERILIEEFNNRQAINEETNYELFKSLSTNNKTIAKKYVRFVIRGKKNRDVPVLLDTELTRCILLLIEHRRHAKIHHQNPYLFALPGNNVKRFKFLRACQLLREFSDQCKAEMPISLRGTQLRKHIATKCILLNLQNDEVADLANYMGHAETIHREYYRQPIVSRDILRMSQLLEKAQEGINANEEEESDSDKENEIEENKNSGKENTVDNTKSSDLNYNRTEKIESRRMKSVDLYKNTPGHTDTSHESINSTKRKRSTSPYGKTKRRRWNNEEQNTVMQLFGKYIQSSHLPPTQDILTAIRAYKCLQGRTAPQIRTWLHNQRKLKQKSNSLRTDVSSSYEDSNDEEDSQQTSIMKYINSIFKQDIKAKHIPSVDECTRAQKKSKLLSNLSIKQIQTAVFNLISE